MKKEFELDEEKYGSRDDIINEIAEERTENAEICELEEAYKYDMIDRLSDCTDSELLEMYIVLGLDDD